MPPKAKTVEKWYHKPWSRVTGVVVMIFTVFGAGYKAGEVVTEDKNVRNEVIIRTEYETRIQQIQNQCRQENIAEYKKITDKLVNTLEMMSNKK